MVPQPPIQVPSAGSGPPAGDRSPWGGGSHGEWAGRGFPHFYLELILAVGAQGLETW